MNMQMLDWLILCAFIAMVIGFAIHASRLNRSVADFLSANRCARRYLLSTSDDVAGIGAVTFIAFFEMYYRTGFAGVWWNMFTWPLMLMISLAGWVIYRFRETRALTMAQFFEIRYSRRFRIFCGILAWTAGVINMGIFPAVTARFFIYFCGLPESISIGQLFSVQTFALIMVIELSIALMFVLFGGMIVIAITDFIQGLFCNIAFVIILLFLYSKFEWSQIITALESAPANASMLNPYKTTQTEGFSLWYFLMLAFAMFYGVRAWQGTQGFNSAAKNAHEAKMAGLLSRWRQIVSLLLLVSLPVCAFTILNHPDFKDTAVNIQSAISNIPNEQIAKQMTVPLVLSKVLPVGIMGLFAAIMFAAAISTDGACLHSWGSIFVQDVILPFRQKGFEPKKHISTQTFLLVCGYIYFLLQYVIQTNRFYFHVHGFDRRHILGGRWRGYCRRTILEARNNFWCLECNDNRRLSGDNRNTFRANVAQYYYLLDAKDAEQCIFAKPSGKMSAERNADQLYCDDQRGLNIYRCISVRKFCFEKGNL